MFRLLDELPEEFTREDLKRAMEACGKKSSNANEYLSRLIRKEMII
ncbi:MAG: hypothetical protein J6Y59_04925 [Bacteroidaceae bacterium]|nr:hypothetical protein [Bacteroidaceae bacterium]